MGMVMILHLTVDMAVDRFLFAMGMGMAVDVLMFVGVNQFSMAMLMRVNMVVPVGMLQGDGVLHQQYRCAGHNHQSHIKLYTRPLPKQKDTKKHAQKRCDRIVCTCFGSAKFFLRLDIEIDAP